MGRSKTTRRRWIAAGTLVLGASAMMGASAQAQMTLQLEALWGWRSAPEPRPLASTDISPGSGNLFVAEHLEFDWGPGVRGIVGFADQRLELGGVFQSWRAEYFTGCSGPCVVLIETGAETTAIIAGAHSRTMTNETSLYGGFANAVARPSASFGLSIGAAYYALNDVLSMTFDRNPIGDGDGLPYETFAWDVTNRLAGPQVGARLSLGEDRQRGLFATLDGNAAFLFNSILRHATWDEEVAGPQADITATDRALGWMLEGGASIGINVSEHVQLSLGYRASWFANVALAPEQVDATYRDIDRFDVPNLSDFMTQSVTAAFTIGF